MRLRRGFGLWFISVGFDACFRRSGLRSWHSVRPVQRNRMRMTKRLQTRYIPAKYAGSCRKGCFCPACAVLQAIRPAPRVGARDTIGSALFAVCRSPRLPDAVSSGVAPALLRPSGENRTNNPIQTSDKGSIPLRTPSGLRPVFAAPAPSQGVRIFVLFPIFAVRYHTVWFDTGLKT